MVLTTWAEQDLEQHERRSEAWLASRPECSCCGDPIQDDTFYEPEPDLILCGDCWDQYVFDNIAHTIEE